MSAPPRRASRRPRETRAGRAAAGATRQGSPPQVADDPRAVREPEVAEAGGRDDLDLEPARAEPLDGLGDEPPGDVSGRPRIRRREDGDLHRAIILLDYHRVGLDGHRDRPAGARRRRSLRRARRLLRPVRRTRSPGGSAGTRRTTASSRQLMRFHVPPGRARARDRLRIGRPARRARSRRVGVGVDVSPRMVERARERAPGAPLRARSPARSSTSARRSTTSSSPISCRTSTTCSRSSSGSRRTRTSARASSINSYSRAWRPIVRLAEALRLKPRKPLRNWVVAARRAQPARARRLRDGDVALADPLPEAGAAALDVPERRSSEACWPFSLLSLTYWIVARPLPTRASGRRASRSSARAGTSRATSRS